MNRQNEIDQLRVSLTKTIQKWIDEVSDSDQIDLSSFGYFGDNIARNMAFAGVAVLECQADTQDYLKAENYLDA